MTSSCPPAIDNRAAADYPPRVGTALFLTLVAASRIVVSEVMANPRGVTGVHMPEDRNEFVELYNASDSAVDLLSWTLDDGDAVDRLQAWTDSSIRNPGSLLLGSTRLEPHSFAVVLDPEYTDTAALGGYEQPYAFGSGTLILTVGNTTIGDGLTANDPVTLASAEGDTSTFGTPADTADSIPCDAGDGMSWERIDAAFPDEVSNWVTCLDTAGCTPGAANSVTTFLDLALTGITLADSSVTEPGGFLFAVVGVANSGFRLSAACSVCVFLDGNGNAVNDPGEYDILLTGGPLRRGEDTSLSGRLPCPSVRTDLCARLVNRDGDSTNDLARLSVIPGGSKRLFDLSLSSFSPDGDGFEESLGVFFHLPEAKGVLKVMVFDLGGREVATLFSGKPPDTNGVVCWDGRKSTGGRAATGIYAVCVEYRCDGATRAEKLPVVLLRK